MTSDLDALTEAQRQALMKAAYFPGGITLLDARRRTLEALVSQGYLKRIPDGLGTYYILTRAGWSLVYVLEDAR